MDMGQPSKTFSLHICVNRPLTRISHQLSAAAADKAVSTALRSVTVLDVLSSTPARANRRAPCIHSLLPRLATTPGEKCGLVAQADFIFP